MTFITRLPGLLNIAQLLLDLYHLGVVTSVLPEVVTELDSGTSIRSSDFNNDVQWLGFIACCFVCVIVFDGISIDGSKT